jgi:hypothetical protein
MTLIYNAGIEGPQTHALLIGVGEYPYLAEGRSVPGWENFKPRQIPSAPRSAELLANWMIRRFSNPKAPLGTVELLAASPTEPFVFNAPQRGTSRLTVSAPTLQNVRSSAQAWASRVHQDRDNIAVMYFCGHAIAYPEQWFLLLQDFGAPEGAVLNGAIDFREFLFPMRYGIAQRQIYFIDGSRVPNPRAPTLDQRDPDGVLPSRRPDGAMIDQTIVYSAGTPDEPFFPSDRPSLFAIALSETLEGPELASYPIGTVELARQLVARVEGVSKQRETKSRIEVQYGNAFDFQFPRTSAPEQSPPTAPDAPVSPQAEDVPPTSDNKPAPQLQPPAPEPAANEDNTQFVADDAEIDQDELGRGILAIALARRLHKIWCSLNGALAPDAQPSGRSILVIFAHWLQKNWSSLKGVLAPDVRSPTPGATAETPDSASSTGKTPLGESCFFDRARDNTRAAFVVHLDAPWGGGKTTFANFVARVMNPYGFEHGRDSFLRQRYGDLRKKNIGAVFLEEPPSDGNDPRPTTDWPAAARRPWIIVQFNAWQVEHVSPPWWVFYQAIRKRCVASILCEGNAPVDLKAKLPQAKARLWDRLLSWAGLWCREYFWRLANPKVKMLLATALLSLVLLAILYLSGIVALTGKAGEQKLAFNIGNGIGLVLAGITTIGTIWGLGALVTESIVPGSNTLAERLSLGSGDPFERFRRHFYESIERLKRPVMVIIDDLDRCKPQFIVDLVRGIQTLLRSPRVVFVILGDRDWIERAFESHHKAMSKISVGPEQTFGARFVEKAIQMSFVLPKLPQERQSDYVRRILIGRQTPRRGRKTEDLKQEVAVEVRRVTQGELAKQEGGLLEPKIIQDKVIAALQQADPAAQLDNPQVVRTINEEIAIQAAGSAKVEQEITHRLEPLADYFPANPRQIKRIINAVTIYHAVSLQWANEKKDKDSVRKTDEDRWFQLALWIIVMTEWPETWRLLASFPDLADLIPTNTPPDKLTTVLPHKLPGSEKVTRAEIDRIRSDAALMALITGEGGRKGPMLDTAAIRVLADLTPVYARRSRLEDRDGKKGKEAKSDKEPAEEQ